MSQKYYKTHAVAQAFVREPGWEPKTAQAMLEEAAPQEVQVAAAGTEIDPEKDLLQVESVLVSTGMNRNKDVFLPDELAPARASGKHKPFNLEHNSDQIVGHMTRSFITTKDGVELTEAQIANSLPSDFDITNEGVVYAFVKPQAAEEIKKRAAAGELFVSVEMWFTDYDYLLGTSVIKRNSATAFLDDHLSCNGGDGQFKGEELGRVLRNMLIGGIAFVKRPANPDSVIKSVASLRSEAARDVQVCNEPALKENLIEDLGRKSLASQSDREETKMSDALISEIAATVEHAIKAASKDTEKTEVEEKVEATTAAEETKVETPEDKTDAAEKTADNQEIQSLTAAVKELTNTVKSQSEEISALKQEKRVETRRERLTKAGLTGSELQKALELSESVEMNEANFKLYCEMFAEKFNEKNLRSEAAENEQDQGGDEADDEETTVDASESADETLIDMEEVTEQDTDVGSGESKAEASIEEKFSRVISGQLQSRNRKWSNVAASLTEED